MERSDKLRTLPKRSNHRWLIARHLQQFNLPMVWELDAAATPEYRVLATHIGFKSTESAADVEKWALVCCAVRRHPAEIFTVDLRTVKRMCAALGLKPA